MSELKLGDRVVMTGTVNKVHGNPYWRLVRYEDAPVPGFTGWTWKNGPSAETHHPRAEGIVVGKRRYRSMENDEGIWVPDGVQDFVGYLIAWHLSRDPVIVRLDQLSLAGYQPGERDEVE